MDYLANPFNLSINSLSNDGICGIFNIASINLFYYILVSCVNKLSDIQQEESCLESENDIIAIPDVIFDNIFCDDNVHNNKHNDDMHDNRHHNRHNDNIHDNGTQNMHNDNMLIIKC